MTKKLLLCIAAMFAAVSTVFAAGETVSNVFYTIIDANAKTVSAAACNACEYEKLTIPSTVKIGENDYTVVAITQNGFSRTGITELELPSTLKTINNGAFNGCAALTTITLGGTESIGQSAFAGCTSLTSITFPSSVKTIDTWAFNGCTSLSSITCDGVYVDEKNNGIPQCSNATVFINVPSTATVTVPSGMLKYYRKSVAWGAFVNLTDGSSISVSGVSLNNTTLELFEGKAATLKATIEPEDAANISGSWSSSDATVATVDANGAVKAVKEGTATITFTTEDGNKTATCTVTVKKDTSSNESIAANKAYIYGNMLYIKTSSSKETVCVYSISGQCLDKFVKTTESISVDASVYPTGVLIITSDKGLSLKVMK